MYSPRIEDDLIRILYRKAKLTGKPMTTVLDDLLRPLLVEDVTESVRLYVCHSCRTPLDVVEDNETGYCNHCESPVFVEKS